MNNHPQPDDRQLEEDYTADKLAGRLLPCITVEYTVTPPPWKFWEKPKIGYTTFYPNIDHIHEETLEEYKQRRRQKQ